MILAGVDEAGLGPTLGPLVTASAAFETPDDWRPDTPWRLLSDAIAEKMRRDDDRPAVCDSKILYASGGMPALELILAVIARLLGRSGDFLAPIESGATARHPCYSCRLDPFPAFVEEEAIIAALNRLTAAMAREKARAAHLEAIALYEQDFNRRFAGGLNKNQALLLETGRHLAALAEKFPRDNMLVVVDKQGGRNDYLPFLTALYPGTWVDTVSAGADESVYRLRRSGSAIIFCFRAKADRLSFPTALASLAAKYARERAMAEMNAWFCRELQELKPTAGYPTDARRWLTEVEKSGKSGKLRTHLLIRQR